MPSGRSPCFGQKKTSYPLKSALQNWKSGIDATKAGEIKASVDFRFRERWGDDSTAYETGMFCYSSQVTGEEEEVAYIHLTALLSKHEGQWKVLMENQEGEGTQEEWQELAQ